MAIAASLFVAGCFATPKQIEYYDADCEIQTRKLVLQFTPLQGGNCGRECVAAVLAISASSTIVSGSIVVVGNTVYWLERMGKCAIKPLNRIQLPSKGE